VGGEGVDVYYLARKNTSGIHSQGWGAITGKGKNLTIETARRKGKKAKKVAKKGW